MIKPVSFRWSTELVARIDSARGDVARTIWVRRAVERALSEASGPFDAMQADLGPVPFKEGVRSAAPAQQPPQVPQPSEESRATTVSLGVDSCKGMVSPAAGDASASRHGRSERGVSPSKPIPPRVPFRRDVKPFQRGDK